jgi:hypothetical protein
MAARLIRLLVRADRGDAPFGPFIADADAWRSFTISADPPALPGAFSKSAPSSGTTVGGTALSVAWVASSGSTGCRKVPLFGGNAQEDSTVR